jgi:DNA-binding transcriptional ArsR family regulator
MATKAAPKKAAAAAAAPKVKATKAAAAKPAAASDNKSGQARRASILLKHVSDPTRLQVITILADGEKHVGALCAQLSQSQPAVSHHLALLRHGGIIAPRRQGKNNFYSLTETGTNLAKVVHTLMG